MMVSVSTRHSTEPQSPALSDVDLPPGVLGMFDNPHSAHAEIKEDDTIFYFYPPKKHWESVSYGRVIDHYSGNHVYPRHTVLALTQDSI